MLFGQILSTQAVRQILVVETVAYENASEELEVALAEDERLIKPFFLKRTKFVSVERAPTRVPPRGAFSIEKRNYRRMHIRTQIKSCILRISTPRRINATLLCLSDTPQRHHPSGRTYVQVITPSVRLESVNGSQSAWKPD